MSALIQELNTSFLSYLKSCDILLTKEQDKELNDLFNNINNHYIKKVQWAPPELIEEKAIISIYKFIPFISDPTVNEYLRVYWNRFLTQLNFKSDFKISKLNDTLQFFEYYAKKKLKSKYDTKKSDDTFNYLKNKLNELKEKSPNVKPFIVNLIEDKDYNFITQKDYTIHLIRSNKTITIHENTKCFNGNCIDFYDKSYGGICNKGIIWACV